MSGWLAAIYATWGAQAALGDMGGASGAGGSRLGLALAHWIVEAHGGQISLTSAPGKRTTVSVELPLAPQVDRASHPSNHAPNRAPDQTISPA
jgi:hypothetical protein